MKSSPGLKITFETRLLRPRFWRGKVSKKGPFETNQFCVFGGKTGVLWHFWCLFLVLSLCLVPLQIMSDSLMLWCFIFYCNGQKSWWIRKWFSGPSLAGVLCLETVHLFVCMPFTNNLENHGNLISGVLWVTVKTLSEKISSKILPVSTS